MPHDFRQFAKAGLFLLGFAARDLVAQSTSVPEVGARIRIQTAASQGKWLVGNLASMDTLSVVLEQNPRKTTTVLFENIPPQTFPLSSVRALQVSRGKHGRLQRAIIGAAIGAVLGTVVIGAVGAALTLCDNCEESGFGALAGLFLGPPLGGLFGGGVGIATAPERWQAVPIPGRVGISAAAR